MPGTDAKQKRPPAPPAAKDLEAFYRSEPGQRLSREIENCLLVNWRRQKLADLHLLCIGFPVPGAKALFGETLSTCILAHHPSGARPFRLRGKNISMAGDPAHLPFKNGSYDIAMVFHGLEYMKDPVSFLEELWKVLAPGGRALFMVPNRSGAWRKTGVPNAPSIRSFKFGDFKELLEENGYRVTDAYGVLYGLPVGVLQKILFSGLLKALSGGSIAGFPAYLVFEADKRSGPQKIKLKDPMRIMPGVRAAPKLSPE